LSILVLGGNYHNRKWADFESGTTQADVLHAAEVYPQAVQRHRYEIRTKRFPNGFILLPLWSR